MFEEKKEQGATKSRGIFFLMNEEENFAHNFSETLMDRNLEIPFQSKSKQSQSGNHKSPLNLEDAKNSDWIWKLFFFEDEITCLLSRDFPSEERNFRTCFWIRLRLVDKNLVKKGVVCLRDFRGGKNRGEFRA